MDEHELAWAAGFFDGDGWAALVRSGRGRRRRPMAQINQAGSDGVPEVLTRFRDAVGVGRIAGPRIEDGRKDLYWWIASSLGDVGRTGRLIGPWLSSQKRHQFRVAAGVRLDRPPIASHAWAAGLFDAEGSVSLGRHRTHVGYRVIDASMTQIGSDVAPEELVRFQRLMTLGKVNGPYDQPGASGPVYRWRLSRADDLHAIGPWLDTIKSVQAREALRVMDGQPPLRRGRAEWGARKTHCVHGHEYTSARIRPYVSRGGVQRRVNKQCLICTREQARGRQSKMKIGDLTAADLEQNDGDATW